jgi:hypothetical protein
LSGTAIDLAERNHLGNLVTRVHSRRSVVIAGWSGS